MNNQKYSYKEMQQMLPEYIFNELTISEAEAFENQLINYPDLQKEVEDSKAVFGKIEKIEFNDEISSRSRNLSIKVNHRLKNNSKRENIKLISRIVLPTAALAIIVAMIFLYEDANIFQNQVNLADKNSFYETMQLTTSEKLAVIETIDDADIEVALNDLDPNNTLTNNLFNYSEQFEKELEEIENEIIEDNVNNMKPKEIGTYLTFQSSLGHNLIDDINNLTEDEFKQLLENIENEKII